MEPPGEPGEEKQHVRTMKEQKEWLRKKAAEHRDKHLAALRAAEAAAPPRVQVIAQELEPPPTPPPEAPPSPILQAVAVQSSSNAAGVAAADTVPPPPAESPLEEVTRAGGDVRALAALVAEGNRTELTAALKALGFKALGPRNRIEKELKALLG
jgi:hypothetical protein